ncbi:MAG TPA: hypothetical protein VFR62_14760, partial [Gemmatimonadales bacterium]|nr:hypothetical protein [Gemmatimonadales bacterium]
NLMGIRRRLGVRGLTPAAGLPESSSGRAEEACIRPARLVEGVRLDYRSVGPAEPWPGVLAFLDGVQRMHLVAYAGAAPIYVAEIAAAVRERRGGRLGTVAADRRVVAIARPRALEAAGDALDGLVTLALPEDEPPHPVRDLTLAGRALDRARGQLELDVGRRFRGRSDGWLVVDGALSESPDWASDLRTVGVSKSHSALPFDGADLERYLRLPPGHRTSVFAPESRSIAPVLAWALRLWDWESRDLFHGLVRIEVAPANGDPATADLISRRLIAERAPLSTPDPRWDRLLYGIHSVEQYLHARQGALA